MPKKNLRQRWVVQTKESPKHDHIPRFFNGKSTLSCTYHRNSDLPCNYGFYVSLKEIKKQSFQSITNKRTVQFINSWQLDLDRLMKNKHKSVLWIYSNCGINYRNTYAKALQKYGVKVDIYGRCGKKDPCNHENKCITNMFHQYKFYLAFENSQCFDYITEKTWKSLANSMVPIIYGASIENCQYHLPPNSFLHVNNFSNPKKLTEYIEYLSRNNDIYLRYHEWRKYYIALMDTNKFICGLCESIFKKKDSKQANKSEWWTKQNLCNI